MPKVVFFTRLIGFASDATLSEIPPGYEVEVYDARMSDEEKAEKTEDADFILSLGGSLTGKVMESAKKLKLIQLASAGYDTVDLKTAERLGIPVSNMGAPIAPAVAEHTIALILGVLRRMVQVDNLLRQGDWSNEETRCMDSPELAECTVGIVGLGNIGRTVARLLRGFENPVLYADIVTYPDAERELGVRRVPLDDLLKEADMVTIHVPLMAATRGMIGERELALMKPTSILVNTSRGPVVDEATLTRALEAGTISAAGLDVFEEEPLAGDSPLRKMKNVLLSPHIAGNNRATWYRRGRFAFENMQRVMEGKEPLSPVQAD